MQTKICFRFRLLFLIFIHIRAHAFLISSVLILISLTILWAYKTGKRMKKSRYEFILHNFERFGWKRGKRMSNNKIKRRENPSMKILEQKNDTSRQTEHAYGSVGKQPVTCYSLLMSWFWNGTSEIKIDVKRSKQKNVEMKWFSYY